MGDEEVELLERLYRATAGVRSSAASPQQKYEAIARIFSDNPDLHQAFRRLVGQRIACG